MLPPVQFPSAVVQAATRGAQLVAGARYLGAAGLVVLLYDHFLTLGDEINLVWTAPRSFLKWVFLINHYLVEVCLITVANEMSGFNDFLDDDRK